VAVVEQDISFPLHGNPQRPVALEAALLTALQLLALELRDKVMMAERLVLILQIMDLVAEVVRAQLAVLEHQPLVAMAELG
jgi:hypothetical protein